MDGLVLIIVTFMAASFVQLTTQAVTATIVGIRVEKMSLGFGKPIIKLKARPFDIHVGWIPTGGSVNFTSDFDSRRLSTRWLVILSGPLAVLACVAPVLGVQRAAWALAVGFGQSIDGALSPLTEGAAMVTATLALAETTSFVEASALLSTKLTAFNLLPLPLLTGGHLWLQALSKHKNAHWYGTVSLLGAYPTMGLAVSWAIAVFVALWWPVS